ncbi:MAG: hypothetical protein K2X60_05750 [Xanthobacteraceae bacterium]|nr:hypothetical protein [Xanthobacteraceae bacterium]
MFARFAFGVLLAATVVSSAFAEPMNADQARKFVANKMFSFNCFDGTRGVGRIYEDGSAVGSVQFSGSGPIRHLRLPTNTVQVRSGSVCASVRGMPFDPCFNLDKYDEVSFRGAVSGLGFAYCDFRRQGNVRMLLTRALSRPRSSRAGEPTKSADASRSEAAHVEPASTEPAQRSEPVMELRKSKAE